MLAVAFVHAGISAWREPFIEGRPYHRWYVYAVYILVCIPAMMATIYASTTLGGYRAFRVASTAMTPTLLAGDYFIMKAGPFDPRNVGEVVLYRRDDNRIHVHRLVATAGDLVAVQGGRLIVNGEALGIQPLCRAQSSGGEAAEVFEERLGSRRYAVQHFDKSVELMREREEGALQMGQFFVMGDNRDNSADSRAYGDFAESQFVGRALYVIWSDERERIGRSLSPDLPVVASEHCPGAQ